MVIDIPAYVDYIRNTYIHYDVKHFPEEDSRYYFDRKYQYMKNNMVDRAKTSQLQALVDKNRSAENVPSDLLQFLQEWDSGVSLDIIMEDIANKFNEYVDIADKNDFATIVADAQKYKNLFTGQKNSLTKKRLTEFFNLIKKGLRAANGKVSRSFAQILNNAVNQGFQNTNFNLVSKNQLEEEAKILNYLNNAKKILMDKGSIDSKSFSSTITNIFSTVLGEKIAAQAIGTIGSEVLSNIENEFLKVNINGQPKMVGATQTVTGKTSKTDVLNENAFSLSFTDKNGKEFAIEVATNLSVKWYAGLNENSEIHIVNASPIYQYFTNGSVDKYYAYNLIEHYGRSSNSEAFRTMRASLAATFFNDWLTGQGQQFNTNSGSIDKVQFLMINGKIYSVLSIIRNICEELNQLNNIQSASMPIKIHFSKPEGKWQGGNNPNWEDAYKRSKMIQAVIDKFTISTSFNYNILTKYAR